MRDTRLVLVTGLDRGATGWVAGRLLHAEPGTVVVHHDMSALAEGIVHRRVRTENGLPTVVVLGLAHGCVSCTLREDMPPLLRALVAKPDVRRVPSGKRRRPWSGTRGGATGCRRSRSSRTTRHLDATLCEALLSDDELAADWGGYEDPFTAREPLEDKA